MRKKKKYTFFYLKKISQGILLSLCVLTFLLLTHDWIPEQVFLYETLPHYNMGMDMKKLFKYDDPLHIPQRKEADQTDEPAGQKEAVTVFKVDKIEETPLLGTQAALVGLHDVKYQPGPDSSNVENHFFEESITLADIDKLRDLSYLKTKFYTVDPRTAVTAMDFNVDEFLKKDLTITREGDKPKVLIFHTHSTEMYKDSDPGNPYDGILGVGEKLCTLLNQKGIKTIHATDRFDLTDGKSAIDGAYERMESVIQKILADNPSIEIAIDLHRDGVKETTHLVSNVGGKQTAQIMFFNGLSKIYQNGTLNPIQSLENRNLSSNLAFSFQLQLKANGLYPGFTRKIYLNAYRYSLHMLPKSTLIEVGAQTNTKQEALNAMEPLAEILEQVLLK